MFVRKSSWWVCLLWLTATSALAATPPTQTPEQVVQAYLNAIQTEGMAVAPAYIHPDELTRFKETLMPLFRREAQSGKKVLTPLLLGSDPTLASIEAMPPAELMSEVFKIVGRELEAFNSESLEIVGSVREGQIVHVVSRIGIAGPKGVQAKTMEVFSVKPYKNGWKLMLTGKIESLAAALSAQ